MADAENTGQAGGTGQPISQDSKNMAMLCHLLGIFTLVLGPLIIWLIKKDGDAFVDDQGKEAINWQITVIIGCAIGIVPFIGWLIAFATLVCNLIFCIMGTMAATNGTKYRYPFAIRLLK